jgi:sugar phosphate isomerase/epimerase
MRLGLCAFSYQHLLADPVGMFADRTSAEFDWRGLPRPYLLQTETTVRPESFELWQIERARQLGAAVVETPLTAFDDEHLDRVRAALVANRQQLVPTLGLDFMASGPALEEGIAGAVATIERYGAFGGIDVVKTCQYPMVHNRFRDDPPLREQLDRIIDGVRPLVVAAERAGLVLAWENHLDYRASEVVEIIEAIGSRHLGFLFDTGNCLPVAEDPVAAARVAAPYTVYVHVKDIVVLPWTPASPGYVACMYACPLGEGNVALREVIEILVAGAPSPETLVLAAEAAHGPPNTDEDRWTEAAFAWMRHELGDLLGGP